MGALGAAAWLLQSEPARAAGGGEVASITFSPLHLLFPVFEAQAEFRLVPAVGIAVIGGFGSIKSSGIRFSTSEVGGQLALYPIGDFRSLQLGAELMWVHVSGGIADVTGVASGVAAGPFVGYKLIAKQGFTFFIQGGAQYVFAHASASDSSGNSASASKGGFVPLLNINLGWSF